MRIAVNCSYRQLQRARPRLRLVPLEEAGSAPAAATEAPGVRGLLDEERRRALLDALDGLSPRERVVFVLREMQGQSTEEVARLLGIREVTVRRHASRARERLMEILRERRPELLES